MTDEVNTPEVKSDEEVLAPVLTFREKLVQRLNGAKTERDNSVNSANFFSGQVMIAQAVLDEYDAENKAQDG